MLHILRNSKSANADQDDCGGAAGCEAAGIQSSTHELKKPIGDNSGRAAVVGVAGSQDLDTAMPDADSSPRPTRSWYGSWQRGAVKDSPRTNDEKREATPSAPASPSQRDLATTPTRHRATSHLSPGASSRSLPLTSTTKLNISSDGSLQDTATNKPASLKETGSTAGGSTPTMHTDEAPPSASVTSAQNKPASVKPIASPPGPVISNPDIVRNTAAANKPDPSSTEPASRTRCRL